jgi:hypothetical protein
MTGGPSFIYALSLYPERRPYRVKLGCSAHLDRRFATHRRRAPGLEVLRFWPVPDRMIEGIALEAAGTVAKPVEGREIFETAHLEGLLRADAWAREQQKDVK